MNRHPLRRNLARASVISLCALGVTPLGSGVANAEAPPPPRVFDATLLGLSGDETDFADICDQVLSNGPDNIPTTEQQANFAETYHLSIRFDAAPLPPLQLLRDSILGSLTGPDLLFGLGGTLTGGEIVDHVTGLDLQLPAGGDQMVFSYDGDDVILGGSDNDYICSGEGGDVILAGGGNNEIVGGSGEDVILGGSGDDISDSDNADLLCLLAGGNNYGC